MVCSLYSAYLQTAARNVGKQRHFQDDVVFEYDGSMAIASYQKEQIQWPEEEEMEVEVEAEVEVGEVMAHRENNRPLHLPTASQSRIAIHFCRHRRLHNAYLPVLEACKVEDEGRVAVRDRTPNHRDITPTTRAARNKDSRTSRLSRRN